MISKIEHALDDVVDVHVRRRQLCFRDYLFEHAVKLMEVF